jgi:hypothetical protein
MNVQDLTIRQVIAMSEEIRSKRPLPQNNVGSTLDQLVKKYRVKSLKVFTFSLATQILDAVAETRNVQGTFLQYLSSTNPTDLIRVRYGTDGANDFMPWQPGNGLLGFPFANLSLAVPTAIAGATATFVYAQVDPDEVIRFI